MVPLTNIEISIDSFLSVLCKYHPAATVFINRVMRKRNYKKVPKRIFVTNTLTCSLQAYTSQFVALVMFALLMCDDRKSVQPRRREIIHGLKVLPGKPSH